MKQDTDRLRGGPFLHCLQKVSELDTLPITVLKQIQRQMRMDLETIEKVSEKKRVMELHVITSESLVFLLSITF